MPIAWTIRRHALAWVGLAGFALAYLTGLYLFYAETMTSGSFATAPTGIRVDGTVAAGVEEIRGEIAILRRQVDQMKRREDDLRKRLTAMESAFGPNTASLPPQSEERDIVSSTQRNAIARAEPARVPVSVTYTPLPEDGFGDLMIEKSPLPIANSGQMMKTMFGVELGTGKSADALQKQWAALGARHKALLAGLQARHQESPTDKQAMRLIAGPFPNAAEAAQLCASLRTAGTECKEAVFAGESFQ